jgi:hypothetical protein
MGAPERKLAFQKSTGSWVIVAPAGNGYEVAETLDPEDASNWTGEAYDLASAHPKASAELKPKLDWYRDNMLNEPSGPLDENGKTTATPQPGLAPANDNAAPVRPSPVAEDDKPSSVWGALAKSGKSFLTDLGNAGAATFGDGPLVQEPPAWLRSDDAEDTARGVGQGASFRFGDELSAGLEAADATLTAGAEDLPSAQRRSGRAFDAPLMSDDEREDAYYDEALGRNRTGNATSQERSPWLYGAGEAVGMTPATIATAPLFGTSGAAAQVPWKTLAMRSVGQGAVQGAATGAGGGTEGNRLSSSAIGAGTGAAGGFAGSAIGSGIGAGARWAGDKADDALAAVKDTAPVRAMSSYAGNLANRARAAATGAYGGQLKTLAKNEGFDFVDNDLGAGVERLFPPEEGFLGFPKARTARDYAELAGPKQEEIGATIGRTLQQMDDQGVSAPIIKNPLNDERAVLDVLDERIAEGADPMNVGADDKVMQKALNGVRQRTLSAVEPNAAQAIGRAEMPRLKPTELAAMKRSLERSGYASEATKGLPQGVQREAQRLAAAGPREALRDAAERQASPETYARWNSANRDFPIAKTVAELAEGRAAQEQGNQIVSLPGAMATAIGGPLAAPTVGAWEVAKRYGADASANALRGVQRATQLQHGPSPAPSPALQQATQAAGARAGVPWGSLVRQGQPAMAQGAPRVEIGEAQITKRPQERAATSSGHNVQRQVTDALKAYGQALGPFKEQLRAVQDDPVALSAAISDLMEDPKFRDGVLPQLQAVDDARAAKGGAR